jgi:hypothetical protein
MSVTSGAQDRMDIRIGVIMDYLILIIICYILSQLHPLVVKCINQEC